MTFEPEKRSQSSFAVSNYNISTEANKRVKMSGYRHKKKTKQ